MQGDKRRRAKTAIVIDGRRAIEIVVSNEKVLREIEKKKAKENEKDD